MAKKKEEVSPVGLQETLDKLNEKFGVNTVITLDQRFDKPADVISTGSIGFDYGCLGIGGFVKGRLYELRGWEGSGKTTICGTAAAECQKKGGVVAYIDGEHALDVEYFRALGVDTSKMLISQPDNGEQGFETAQLLIQSKGIDLLIVDSDSSLIPLIVMQNDYGSANIGKKAKLNSDAYPKIKNALSDNDVCVLVVSQYREKIGVMFGDPRTTQGGKALGYWADTIIDVSKSLKKEGDETSGNITKVKTIKNKTFSPYKMVTFDVLFGQGVDKIGEIIELANDHEIIKKWGKSITYKETKYEVTEFEALLRDNDEFFEEIKQQVIQLIKNQ